MIKDLGDKKPIMHEDSFIAETASVMGDVKIGQGSSIWYGAVARGDTAPITMGSYTNVQDNATIHTETDIPTTIGDYTVIGHNAIVHGSTVGDNVLIGMGAIVLNKSIIGDNCIIGAGTLIREGMDIPANSMVVGVPGKIIRQVTEDEVQAIKKNAIRYYDLWVNQHK